MNISKSDTRTRRALDFSSSNVTLQYYPYFGSSLPSLRIQSCTLSMRQANNPPPLASPPFHARARDTGARQYPRVQQPGKVGYAGSQHPGRRRKPRPPSRASAQMHAGSGPAADSRQRNTQRSTRAQPSRPRIDRAGSAKGAWRRMAPSVVRAGAACWPALW